MPILILARAYLTSEHVLNGGADSEALGIGPGNVLGYPPSVQGLPSLRRHKHGSWITGRGQI